MFLAGPFVGCAAVTEVGTAGRLRAAVWPPVASEMEGWPRPAGGRAPAAGGGGRRRLPFGVEANALPGVAACACLRARAQLRFCNRQSAASFGGPDGAVVGARRDVWRSEGVLRDGYCGSCWSDLQNRSAKTAMKSATAAWLCRRKHTHNCILDFACNTY